MRALHDFNFYTERGIIPVLSSPAEVENAQNQLGSSYMIIKEKDLRQLSTVDSRKGLFTKPISSTPWSLIDLKGEAGH